VYDIDQNQYSVYLYCVSAKLRAMVHRPSIVRLLICCKPEPILTTFSWNHQKRKEI